MTTKELLEDINSILDDFAPEDKDHTDFNGGYVQQLKNSNQLVAFFGMKKGQKNRESVKIQIEADELDEMYMMLKAKIHELKNDGTKTVKVSLAQRRLTKRKKETIETEIECSNCDDNGCHICS